MQDVQTKRAKNFVIVRNELVFIEIDQLICISQVTSFLQKFNDGESIDPWVKFNRNIVRNELKENIPGRRKDIK